MSETGNRNLCALSVVGIVVDKGKGKKTVKLLNSKGFDYHFAMLGRGTAPSEIQSYLRRGSGEGLRSGSYEDT